MRRSHWGVIVGPWNGAPFLLHCGGKCILRKPSVDQGLDFNLIVGKRFDAQAPGMTAVPAEASQI